MRENSTIDLPTNVFSLQDSEMKSFGNKATTLSNKVVMVTFVKRSPARSSSKSSTILELLLPTLTTLCLLIVE